MFGRVLLSVLQVAWRKILDGNIMGSMFVDTLKPIHCRERAGPWHNVLDALFCVAQVLKVCKPHLDCCQQATG